VQNRFSEEIIATDPLASGVLLNDAGQIVLTGLVLPNTEMRTMFVLTPIPEPSTYVLILTGLCSLGFFARRRKAAFGNGPHGETAPTSAVSCLR
jgi:hypothetical protein